MKAIWPINCDWEIVIFDAAASAGNMAMDLFGAFTAEAAPVPSAPVALVLKMSAEAIELAATLPAEPPPAPPPSEDEPFPAVFADAESAISPEASPEEDVSEDQSEDPAPTLKATNEPVAPETLRMIFPVHYFYTEMQISQAVDAAEPEQAQETPRVERPSSKIVATQPIVIRTPESHAPEPRVAEENPALQEPPVTESEPTYVATDEVPETAFKQRPARVAEPLPTPMAPPVRQVHASVEPPLIGEVPHHIEADPRAAAAPEAPPPVLRELARAPKAAPVQEVPKEAPKVASPVRHEQSTGQDSSRQCEFEVQPEPVNRPEPRAGSETGVQAVGQVSNKGEHRERTSLTAQLRETSTSPLNVPEQVARSTAPQPGSAVEPPQTRNEPIAPASPVAKTFLEPVAAPVPARSVSIAVEGPRGEDVRAVVQSTCEGVQVRLLAGDERTQQALESGAPELRQRLEQSQRTPPGDVWEGVHRAGDVSADVQSPNADFGGPNDLSQPDSTSSQDDAAAGQRQGQRRFGRRQQQRNAEATEENFAIHFEQGGKS